MASLPSLLLLLLLLPLLSSCLFSPPDNILLNCGGPSPTTAPDLRLFLPDDDHHLSPFHSTTTKDPSSDSDSDSDPLYSTARVFRRPSTYTLPISHPGPHLLRLHFRPFLHLHSARFHVLTPNSVLLGNLSFSSSCMTKAPLIREFFLQLPPSDHSLSLSLSFVPLTCSDLAFVNAIELLSAPADLLPDSATSAERAHLGTTINGVSNGNLETLFRLNVGGSKITPFNDTLWRYWSPDADFPVENPPPSSKPLHFSGRIQYRRYGASRETAPDHVYNTARVMTSGDPNKNMSWSFVVPFDHKYLIRLHFCDIASLALNELYFHIFVNGEMAYENFDVSEATGQLLAAPYYVDFVAGADGNGRVAVTIVPSNMSAEFKVHGLLNGLEIMKMSNSMGNLDGMVPAGVLSRREAGAVGGFAQFVLCAVLFSVMLAAGLMLVSRWRNAASGSSSSLGWSVLPMDAPEERLRYEILMTTGKTPDF